MSGAREMLAELDALAVVLPRASRLPPISQCRRLADASGCPDGAPAAPPGDVVEAIRRELRRACETDGAGSLTRGALRKAPLVMWNGEPKGASLPGLLECFLEAAGERAGWLGSLIEAWLRDFAPDGIEMAATGRVIAARIALAWHPRLSAWRDAHDAFGLFDAKTGPRQVARALLHAPEPVDGVLRRMGMDDPIRATGGYFRACVRTLLDALPDALCGSDADAAWDRAASILQVERTVRMSDGRTLSDSELRFPDWSGEITRACLGPWLGGSPAAMSRDPIKKFLVKNAGDPRLTPSRWTAAGEPATALMRRWLSEATLDAFFRLAREEGDSEQLRYRQKFWRACFDKTSVDVSWVLDPGLADWAKALPDLPGSFGLMDPSGNQKQGVLLMRIGDLVLSEWSHVGPIRAWLSDDPRCPKMDRRHYAASALRALCLDFPQVGGKGGSSDGRGLWHHKPKKYLWQQSAAALLRERAGVHLDQADYA